MHVHPLCFNKWIFGNWIFAGLVYKLTQDISQLDHTRSDIHCFGIYILMQEIESLNSQSECMINTSHCFGIYS